MIALLATTQALAEPAVLLYSGDTGAAARAVTADAGLPTWELEPTRLSERLPGGQATLLGASSLTTCAGAPSTSAAVRDAVTRVEGRVTYAQWAQARVDLDAAIASLACLTEPTEASIGARLYFLDGLVWSASGEVSAAQAAFAQARAFQPSLAWDATLPSELRAPFDAAPSATPASTTVRIGPGIAPGTLVWVDGRPAGGDGKVFPLTAGRHVVQVLGTPLTTLPVEVAPDRPLLLVVGNAISDDLLAGAADGTSRADLEVLLPTLFPGRQVYVWTGDTTVDVTNGWKTLPHVGTPNTLGPDLVAGGALLAGLGAVGAGVGLVGFITHNDAVDGESNAERSRRLAAAGRGMGMTTLGLVGLGVGAVAIGVGLPLSSGHPDKGAAVAVGVGAEGFIVRVGGVR